jgi:GDP/UDP-N,N'-diacetylbacillosamine 2-epimerase (hydrolysing)
VGGMGVDAIKNIELLSKAELESSLGIKFGKRSILITFHPVTLEERSASKQMGELLGALAGLKETTLIFTMPNADTDGRVIFDLIEGFVAGNGNAHAFRSLGQVRYLSCLNFVDVVVGNSSSGLAEVPSFKKPTVNIGDRQKGRIKAASVIDCKPLKDDISRAIGKAYNEEFRAMLRDVKNPYGDGGASENIMKVLKTTDLRNLLKKEFYDLR